MTLAAAFSPDYVAARARFRSSALALGCRLEEHPIGQSGPDGDALTIDLAVLGAGSPERVAVVSSGLHGVEGFLGAAVQAALLEERLGGWRPPAGTALVLIHALNPYGFAWTRRVNEDNADLNRNMMGPGEPWEGAPAGYAALDGLLNPASPPSRVDAFLLRAVLKIARHGLPALKNAVAGGQYEFPEGLFYGGSRPSRTLGILDAELPRHLGTARDVLHVDFHTGLGPWATYKLFVDREPGSERARWLGERFGEAVIEPWAPGKTSYAIRGGMGTWCQARFPGCTYDVLTAEFGTYPVLRIISALRAENRAHHHGDPESAAYRRAKRELEEAFAPRDREWRERSVAQGLDIVQKAIEAVIG